MDPARFATELEIIAVRGFEDMGYVRPKPDGPGQVYCRPTELWAATSHRQCSSGYADQGDS